MAKCLRCPNCVQGACPAANAFQPSDVISWVIWIGVCLMAAGQLEPNPAEEQSQLLSILKGSFRPWLTSVRVSRWRGIFLSIMVYLAALKGLAWTTLQTLVFQWWWDGVTSLKKSSLKKLPSLPEEVPSVPGRVLSAISCLQIGPVAMDRFIGSSGAFLQSNVFNKFFFPICSWTLIHCTKDLSYVIKVLLPLHTPLPSGVALLLPGLIAKETSPISMSFR